MSGASKEIPQFLVQVDHLDKPTGLVEKKMAHRQGILHRAFSVFVFRKVNREMEVLLQQRALEKYHSAGLWTNTCCSHAEPGTLIESTAKNRLQNEMGFSCPLLFAGSFYYRAAVGNEMIEHEIDHVFVGYCNPSQIDPNPLEVVAYRWVTIHELQEEFLARPYLFTAWFQEAFSIALPFFKEHYA